MDNFNEIQNMLGFRGVGGIISQFSKDQGDSLLRESSYYSILNLLGEPLDDRMDGIHEGYTIDIDTLEDHDNPGTYRRSPDPLFWGFNSNNCSRDQLSHARLAMAIYGDKSKLLSTVFAQIKRFGFHQNTHRNYVDKQDQLPFREALRLSWNLLKAGNISGIVSLWKEERSPKIPDISTPGEIATIIRGMNWWLLYPLLYILDIPLLFEGKLIKSNGWDMSNLSVLPMIYYTKKYPTFLSKLAWKNLDKEMCKAQIRRYHSIVFNGIPCLGELYCNLIDKESI